MEQEIEAEIKDDLRASTKYIKEQTIEIIDNYTGGNHNGKGKNF